MDEHFRAFSFVDRITSVEAGVRIRGHYTIPVGVDSFPAPLVTEAVGQLAAWCAMAALDFKCRPVAGIAGNIEMLSPVRPGQVLELAAELQTCDPQAVAYNGTARADGVQVIRLENCVGPMLGIETFDDPQALRDRFALLCGSGAVPGAFGGVPSVVPEQIGGETGQWIRARLHVPESAPFFADHFPRHPVFPGTLLMNANLQLASTLAGQIPTSVPDAAWSLRAVSDVKLRAFIRPGEALEVETRLAECSGDTAVLTVAIQRGKRVVGGARVLFSTEGRP